LRASGEREWRRALGLLRLAAQSYRSTGHRDVLPVALGLWAEAERRCGNAAGAVELAREAANLLDQGAPSLLNESAVYLALHAAYVAIGEEEAARQAVFARHAVARAAPARPRRHTVRAPIFDRAARQRAPARASEGYGLVPDAIHRVLESAS